MLIFLIYLHYSLTRVNDNIWIQIFRFFELKSRIRMVTFNRYETALLWAAFGRNELVPHSSRYGLIVAVFKSGYDLGLCTRLYSHFRRCDDRTCAHPAF